MKLSSGEWRAAHVVGVDLVQDVAVAYHWSSQRALVTIAPAMPRQGQAVAAVGSPQGWGFSLSSGLVSRYGAAGAMFAAQPMLQR